MDRYRARVPCRRESSEAVYVREISLRSGVASDRKTENMSDVMSEIIGCKVSFERLRLDSYFSFVCSWHRIFQNIRRAIKDALRNLAPLTFFVTIE